MGHKVRPRLVALLVLSQVSHGEPCHASSVVQLTAVWPYRCHHLSSTFLSASWLQVPALVVLPMRKHVHSAPARCSGIRLPFGSDVMLSVWSDRGAAPRTVVRLTSSSTVCCWNT